MYYAHSLSFAGSILLPRAITSTQGNWDFGSAYVYVTNVINVSQLWALYCLAGFYLQLHKDMAQLRPLGKFATVKAIVFFSW